MNSKMGYILIVLGLAIVVWGIIIVRKPQKKTETIEINNEQTVKNEAKPTVKTIIFLSFKMFQHDRHTFFRILSQ